MKILLVLLIPICIHGQTVPSKPIADIQQVPMELKTEKDVIIGASRTDIYLPSLKGKRVALVGNHTSLIGKTHLVDSLLSLKIDLKKIFFPEHGFRGNEDAGSSIKNYRDKKTGLPCISLYGKENKKPQPKDLMDVDLVIFDLQDVGVRFYTYISTLHYVMEACAESKKMVMVLDRPNPNGYYIDGPVLEENCRSFVGLHPVPIVHGMTIGEYAQMINGEGWLAGGVKCELKVIPVGNYSHADYYEVSVKPSPNLPNISSIYLYPSLCLFEGTIVSVGRGTDKPFQQFGYPGMKSNGHTFTPKPVPGASMDPPYNGRKCNGFDVSFYGEMFMKHNKKLYLFWILNTYKNTRDAGKYFNSYFKNLAGTVKLQQQIEAGVPEDEIRKSWEEGLKTYKVMRKKYLLYKDFE